MAKRPYYVPASMRFIQGKPSDYILPFSSIRHGDKVVLYVRVSSPSQDPLRQITSLRKALSEVGAVVVKVLGFRCSGYDNGCDDGYSNLPAWATCSWIDSLLEASQVARRHAAKLVATETDRFIRSRMINTRLKSSWDARPTKSELDDLRDLTNGITLVTLDDPDSTPKDVKAQSSIQGQDARGGDRGGRIAKPVPGCKRSRRLEKRPIARRLRRKGSSYGEIAKELKLPRSTIQTWTQDCSLRPS